MKIAIISGSTRQNKPQSQKVALYIKQYIEKQLNHETYLLDLAATKLRYWDENFWSDYNNFDPEWKIASSSIASSDAIVVIAPEWNGMLPPALKNVFHLATKGELANKPGLIVSISSGINGVYPVTELRLNSFKNTYINYIPQHVIIRNVNAVLNSQNSTETEEDQLTKQRLEYSVQVLSVYAQAFVQIRNSEIIKNNPYPYGM